jgi:hypothetical protein
MMMEEYKSQVAIAPGLLMLKWNVLDQHIHQKKITSSNINVFINFECVLKNLSLQKNLLTLVNFHKQNLVIELESAIMNLVANYRMYFHKEGLNPKIYLYYTDLNTTNQQMQVYNKYYRNYYHNRYLQNPQFRDMGNIIVETVVPEIELILSYVPDCYFIKSKIFDSSLIPLIISSFNDNDNIIITSDEFDTLYLFNSNFITIYIKRRYGNFTLVSDIEASVQSIVKDENPFDLTIFYSEMYYRLLLSIKGSKIRNIKSAKGFGYGKFMNLLKEGIDKDIVLKDFESIDSVIELFPEKYREDIKSAFQCTGLDIQYSLLNETDKEEIKSQIIDRFDLKSLETINRERFIEFPINLPGLLE